MIRRHHTPSPDASVCRHDSFICTPQTQYLASIRYTRTWLVNIYTNTHVLDVYVLGWRHNTFIQAHTHLPHPYKHIHTWHIHTNTHSRVLYTPPVGVDTPHPRTHLCVDLTHTHTYTHPFTHTFRRRNTPPPDAHVWRYTPCPLEPFLDIIDCDVLRETHPHTEIGVETVLWYLSFFFVTYLLAAFEAFFDHDDILREAQANTQRYKLNQKACICYIFFFWHIPSFLPRAIPWPWWPCHTQRDTERQRERQRDTERHKETQRDNERHSETQRDTARHSKTQQDTEGHTDIETKTEKHRNRRTDGYTYFFAGHGPWTRLVAWCDDVWRKV